MGFIFVVVFGEQGSECMCESRREMKEGAQTAACS